MRVMVSSKYGGQCTAYSTLIVNGDLTDDVIHQLSPHYSVYGRYKLLYENYTYKYCSPLKFQGQSCVYKCIA